MKLDPRKPSRFGLKEQIKSQLKGLMESGSLKPGDSLPSSRDLALTLGVNRNTTWAAYRELRDEGWLTSSVGSGTYVKAMKTTKHHDNLGQLFDEMLSRAEGMGYERDQVAKLFADRLARPHGEGGTRVLVVECNRETGEHLAQSLERELDVRAEVVLIQEIEQDPGRTRQRLEGIDLVVCGFNHLEEFRAAVPESPVEAVGLLMQPDWRVLEVLKSLPPGSAVGLTCANHRSTETLFREVIYDNGSSLKRIWAGMDDPDGVREMLRECRVVLASSYVHGRVRSLAGAGTEVVMVELKPDPAGIGIVRRCLEERRRRTLS